LIVVVPPEATPVRGREAISPPRNGGFPAATPVAPWRSRMTRTSIGPLTTSGLAAPVAVRSPAARPFATAVSPRNSGRAPDRATWFAPCGWAVRPWFGVTPCAEPDLLQPERARPGSLSVRHVLWTRL